MTLSKFFLLKPIFWVKFYWTILYIYKFCELELIYESVANFGHIQFIGLVSTEVYLEPCQTSMMELFCENTLRLVAVNYFLKKLGCR